MACGCQCGGDEKLNLLYSCSGAANTGYLADQVFRKLIKDDIGSGTCLAAVAADLSGFIKSAQSADKNIVLDGCSVGCGKLIFESRGLPFTEYIITDYDVEKGKTEITPEVVETVANKITTQIKDL